MKTINRKDLTNVQGGTGTGVIDGGCIRYPWEIILFPKPQLPND